MKFGPPYEEELRQHLMNEIKEQLQEGKRWGIILSEAGVTFVDINDGEGNNAN